MKNIVIGLLVLVLCFISVIVGYGAGISDPEPRETRELEKQIKTEELKKLRLNNEIMERALFEEEIK